MAGIKVSALINEPTAAALAYLAVVPDTERVLVYDWGGGTIDVTLLEFRDGIYEERASRGISGLGGIEVDRRLEELILTALPSNVNYRGPDRNAFQLEVERVKILLSNTDDPDDEVPFTTPDGVHEVGVTRRAFEQAIEFPVKNTLEPVERCLADTGLEVMDIDAVLMIGGSSLMPAVRERLTNLLDTEPVDSRLIDPLTAVSQGAALAAAALAGDVDVAFSVISNHALGTRTREQGRQMFSEVIPRGVPLPYRTSKRYTPNADDDLQLRVQVWEGDPVLPLDDPENAMLAELTLRQDKPRKRADGTFELGRLSEKPI